MNYKSHRPIITLSLLIWLAFLPFNHGAFAQVIIPSADSYIHDVNATTNYGTSIEMVVKKGTSSNFRKAYIKFDLTGSGLTTVSSAILRLCATSATSVSMNIHQVADGWTETGITWNNAPAEGTILATTSIGTTPGYYEWDITAYVQSQLASNDKIISVVAYSANATTPTINFNSREAASNHPELVISTNTTLPLAPTDLIANAINPGQINLSWTDHADNETGFRIERKTGSGVYAEVAIVGANVVTYSNTGLNPSTLYTYRVYAYNSSGNSSYSNESSATTGSLVQITYYVDAAGGNDANNGLTPATAWKTLTKVNSFTFSANNRILFKAGGVWTGRLYPKGSGIQGFPVIIDMYDSGNKPLIDGNGMTGTGVVYLYNQQYWEINNLEITNNAASGSDRRGVRIEAENYGTANHIYLKNLNIHNIKGTVGQSRADKRTAGIGYAIVDASLQETHFNDILIDNCVITACENEGIITECVANDGFDPYTPEWNLIKITNAVVSNNVISNISKNAMIIRLFENGVVENNVCFNTANGISGNTIFSASCTGTVFQYNEGYDNNSPDADGSLYDADLRSPNTYWQYSYSHDNSHGLFWTCTVQADVNVVCRYNISQNDQGIIFCINYPVTSCNVYNNTVYIPANLSPIIISERNNGGGGTRTYTFNNNIIYNLSSTASYDWTSSYSRLIDYNCFYGIHPSTEPADSHKVTGDPKLVNPGSGGLGINSVSGYKIQSGSSCINTGKVIAGNGGLDYWGNILYNGLPDIGAHEFTSTSAPASYTITGGGSYCQGTAGLPVGLPGSQIGVDYTLIKNGNPTPVKITGTGNTISFGNQLFGTYTASGTANGTVPSITGTTVMTGSAVITENPSVTASVGIVASANNVCPGTTVTFTATPVGGGTSPTCQWFKNTVAMATGIAYSYIPANGDVIYAVMVSNAPCVTGSPATSNSITMIVSSSVAASVTITVSQNNICDNNSVTFTPTPVGGGNTPQYQWFKNTVAVATGSTYNCSPANGDQVYAVMTSSLACATGSPAASNIITMVVYPNLPVSVSIQAVANPVCEGTPVTIVASAINGGSSPLYQWKVNGLDQGVNNPTFTYSPSNSDQVVCVLNSNALCAVGNPVTSDPVTMIVYPVPDTPVVTKVGEILYSSSATGNQWYKDGVIIAGATGSQYTAISTGSYYTVVTLNGCNSLPSNSIIIPLACQEIRNIEDMYIYPNPCHGQFSLYPGSLPPGIYSFSVYNFLGSLMESEENVMIDKLYKCNIEPKNYPPGLYFILIRNKEILVLKELIIAK